MKKKIFLFILGLVLIMSACSSPSKGEANMIQETTQALHKEEPKSEEADFIDSEGIDNFTSANKEDAGESLEKNRKIIKTGYIMIESTEYDESVRKLKDLISLNNGYVFSSQQYDGNDDDEYDNKNSHYVIKVPSERFDSFMSSSGDIGDLIEKSEEKEDVTTQYMDIEARLKTLKVQEDRLIAILEKSDNLENILELEKELADVRYEIESFEANKRNLDNHVSYSTINVNIREIKIAKEYKEKPISFGEKLGYAFSDSISNAGMFLEGLVLLIVAIFPFLIFIAIMVLIIVFIFKKVKKTNKKKKENKVVLNSVSSNADTEKTE